MKHNSTMQLSVHSKTTFPMNHNDIITTKKMMC